MKKLILSALVLLCSGALMAADRTTNEMKAIAAQQLLGAGVKAAGQGQALKLSCVQEEPSFAIYAPENGAGFVIVSRDDAERPVLGYSLTTFDVNDIPSNLKWWLQRTSKCLEARRANGHKAPVLSSDFEPIAPFMTTKWGQGDYFNNQTPKVINAANNTYEHALTGCVATAMAQIMNYNRWPESANFTGWYFTETPNHPDPKYETIGVNSNYTWPLSNFYGFYYPDGYEPGSTQLFRKPTTTQTKEVSTLMRDCGVAVGMQYSINGSGAQIPDACYAFIQYFQYPEQCVKYKTRTYYAKIDETIYTGTFYTDQEWLQLIANELRCGSPVLYGGQDDNGAGGHAFVLHGMDRTGRVYVNWGWSGKGDGYYAIDHLDTDLGDFNTQTDMITGLRKTPEPTDDYESQFVSFEPYSFYWDETQYYSLQLKCEGGLYNYNYSNNGFLGQIYVVFEDLSSPVHETTYELYEDLTAPDPETGEAAEPWPFGSGWRDFSGWCETELEPGHRYRAYLASKDQFEGHYTPVRVPGGAMAQLIVVDDEGVPSFVGTEMMEYQEIVPVGVKDVRNAEPAADAAITYVYDLQGRLVHSSPTSSFNLWDVPARGVLVVKQGDKVRKVVR